MRFSLLLASFVSCPSITACSVRPRTDFSLGQEQFIMGGRVRFPQADDATEAKA